MTEQQPPTPLIAFLAGRGPDGRGRTIDQVLGFSDPEIERHHDFIQWLFPLPTASSAVPHAPMLSPAEIAAIRDAPHLRQAIQRALERMSAFYARNDHWLVRHDHNHLRITRILHSAGLLLGHEPARAFHALIGKRVEAAGNPVSEVNVAFWREALGTSR